MLSRPMSAFTSVMRRRSEIGIMRAAGVSRLFIVQIFVMEGTLIGVIGGLSGVLLAWAAS